VSIPFSFLCGFFGTILSRNGREDPQKRTEMEVRALTGIGLGS